MGISAFWSTVDARTFTMAFCGTWNKTKSENGLAFFTAWEVPVDQLKRAAAAKLQTMISMNGNAVTIKKTFTEDDGNVKVDENTATLDTECEFTGPIGNKFNATATLEGDRLVIKGSGGNGTVTIEVVDGELVETMTGKGETFKRWSAKA